MAGTLRLNCILYCQHMEEESRRDETEGEARTNEPGTVIRLGVSPGPPRQTIWTTEEGYQEHHTGSLNRRFLFCMCLPEVDPDYMKKKFGPHIVKVAKPRRLAEDIYDHFSNEGHNVLVVGAKVAYNKGHKFGKALTNAERADLASAQKPASYATDREFRIVVHQYDVCADECRFLSGGPEDPEPQCRFVKVQFGKTPEYLRAMSGDS